MININEAQDPQALALCVSEATYFDAAISRKACELIKTPEQLADFFNALPIAQASQHMQVLGMPFYLHLKAHVLISVADFASIQSEVHESHLQTLIIAIGENIGSDQQSLLAEYLEWIPYQYLSQLGKDFIQTLFITEGDPIKAIYYVSAKRVGALVAKYGMQFFTSMVGSVGSFGAGFAMGDKPLWKILTEDTSPEDLYFSVNTPTKMRAVLLEIGADNRARFFTAAGSEFIENAVFDTAQLAAILSVLPMTAWQSFLSEKMDNAFLANLVSSVEALSQLVDPLVENRAGMSREIVLIALGNPLISLAVKTEAWPNQSEDSILPTCQQLLLIEMEFRQLRQALTEQKIQPGVFFTDERIARIKALKAIFFNIAKPHRNHTTMESLMASQDDVENCFQVIDYQTGYFHSRETQTRLNFTALFSEPVNQTCCAAKW